MTNRRVPQTVPWVQALMKLADRMNINPKIQMDDTRKVVSVYICPPCRSAAGATPVGMELGRPTQMAWVESMSTPDMTNTLNSC